MRSAEYRAEKWNVGSTAIVYISKLDGWKKEKVIYKEQNISEVRNKFKTDQEFCCLTNIRVGKREKPKIFRNSSKQPEKKVAPHQ